MSNLAGTDPEVRAKNDLVITLVDGKHVLVEDADHKGGGNVRARGGKPIFWTNSTGHPCELIFREFLADDDQGDGDAHWPFRETPSTAPNRQTIAAGTFWKGTLKRGLEAFIKYDVVVKNGATPEPRLDPIIIVERRS